MSSGLDPRDWRIRTRQVRPGVYQEVATRAAHFLKRCECGRVLSQCRCPGPKTETVVGPCRCKEPCPRCNGFGQVREVEHYKGGVYSEVRWRACPRCHKGPRFSAL